MKVNLKLDLDKRQKIIILLILLSFVILIWQLHGFFSAKQSTGFNISQSEPTKSQPVFAPSPMPAHAIQPIVNSAEADAVQQKYLSLVNEYQLVEMEKMIAQDEASIAQSRAQSAESMAKIAQLTGETPNFNNTNNSSSSHSGDYELIYTGEDNHQWTATLRKQGQFNDVTAGTILPDGTKIVSVDDNGVTMIQGDIKKLITFNGITIISEHNKAEQVEKKSEPKPVKSPEIIKPTIKKMTVLPSLPVPQNLEKPLNLVDITKLNKNAYTIQLIRGSNLTQIKNVISQNNLESHTQVIKMTHLGQTVYIAIYGNYPDSDTAMDALDDLPAQLQKLNPFVKKASDLQLEMGKKS